MSQMRLTPAAKALLSAAKVDAPGATSRANVWSGVARTVGTVAGASTVASAAGGTSAKALLVGTLFGGTATVGLALALLCFGSVPALPQGHASVGIAPAAALLTASISPPGPLPALGSSEAPTVGPSVRGSDTGPARDLAASETRPSQRACGRHGAVGSAPAGGLAPCRHSPRKTPPAVADEDPLTQEAWLVGEARSALADGDAQSALRAIRATAALPARQLVPEELAVEARALRSLGRSAEAKDVGDLLKARYPESALAR